MLITLIFVSFTLRALTSFLQEKENKRVWEKNRRVKKKRCQDKKNLKRLKMEFIGRESVANLKIKKNKDVDFHVVDAETEKKINVERQLLP